MGLYAFMAGIYTLPVALLATALFMLYRFIRGKSPRPLTWTVLISWTAVAACVAFLIIAELVIGRWRLRGEFPSPDHRSTAVVESQHSSFFSDYEVNFRLRIRDAADGKVLSETVLWEADVVQHPWEVPDSAVEWSPDSHKAALTVNGHRANLSR